MPFMQQGRPLTVAAEFTSGSLLHFDFTVLRQSVKNPQLVFITDTEIEYATGDYIA
jgi:hypothetical protein